MEEKYYCPECGAQLEKITGCGSISYFCNKCNSLVSKNRILTESILKEKSEK